MAATSPIRTAASCSSVRPAPARRMNRTPRTATRASNALFADRSQKSPRENREGFFYVRPIEAAIAQQRDTGGSRPSRARLEGRALRFGLCGLRLCGFGYKQKALAAIREGFVV